MKRVITETGLCAALDTLSAFLRDDGTVTYAHAAKAEQTIKRAIPPYARGPANRHLHARRLEQQREGGA